MTWALRSLDLSSESSSSVNYDKMQLQILQNSFAPRPSLSTLPGEIISEILQFAMQSEEPIYMWLFPGLKHPSSWQLNEYSFTSAPRYPSRSTFDQQAEHFSDWKCVTSTCRRFRDYGIPAFFRQKRFVIPCTLFCKLRHTASWELGKTMLWQNNGHRLWQKDGYQYVNFVECIRHIIVPSFREKCRPFLDFEDLPRWELTSLASVTVWAADYREEEARVEIAESMKIHGGLVKGIDIKVEGIHVPE